MLGLPGQRLCQTRLSLWVLPLFQLSAALKSPIYPGAHLKAYTVLCDNLLMPPDRLFLASSIPSWVTVPTASVSGGLRTCHL